MKNLLTTKEVAKFLKVSGCAVARYKKLGLISPAKKVGLTNFYRKSEIKAFVTPGFKRLKKNKPFYEMKKSPKKCKTKKCSKSFEQIIEDTLQSSRDEALFVMISNAEFRLRKLIRLHSMAIMFVSVALLVHLLSHILVK
jgi:hypothetical protein